MIRREPTETGGTYYRVLPEGHLDQYDGFTLRIRKIPQGIDLNRNFPGSWRQEFEQNLQQIRSKSTGASEPGA